MSVEGDLKLGNFTLSFSDMAIPVSGVPITVTRTYDTLTANQSGDFGYGWRLEFRNVKLRTSLPATGMEADGVYNAFRDGTKVYVTLPGGKREGFTFRPIRQFFMGAVYYQLNFVPDRGVKSELTVSGQDVNGGQFGGIRDLFGDRGAVTLFKEGDQ